MRNCERGQHNFNLIDEAQDKFSYENKIEIL